MALNYHGLPIENESVSAVTLTNTVDLGTVRIFAGEEYIYAYNDTSAAVAPGYGMVMSGYTGMSVTVSSNTFFNVCIGVVKHATLVTASYGWLLTRGFASINMDASSSGIVGGPIFLGGSGKFYGMNTLNTLTTTFSQVTSLFGLVPAGVVVQATASAGTAYAYMRCFGS